MTRNWKLYQKEKNITGHVLSNKSVGDIQKYHDLFILSSPDAILTTLSRLISQSNPGRLEFFSSLSPWKIQ